MGISIKNLWLGLLDQGPPTRLLRNILLRRISGLFHPRSHQTKEGRLKIAYRRKESAISAASSMSTKTGADFSHYKCLYCDGYHVGKNYWKKRVDTNK